MPILGDLTETQLAEILARPKYWAGDLVWATVPDKIAFYEVTANLLDERGATIQGLTVQMLYKRGRFADDCKYLFTVFYYEPGGKKHRVYQIEVVPPERCSHRENGVPIYGPHQHFGHRGEKIEGCEALGCDTHEEWLYTFCGRANIAFSGKYLPPAIQVGLFEE